MLDNPTSRFRKRGNSLLGKLGYFSSGSVRLHPSILILGRVRLLPNRGITSSAGALLTRTIFFLVCLFSLTSHPFENATAADVTSSVILVRPKAWDNAVGEWVKYRERDYQVIKVDSVSSAHNLQSAILDAAKRAKFPVAAVLLCGDIGITDEGKAGIARFTPITPTFETETRVKLGPFTTPTLATDVFYGDLDGDECPDLAVGRLPAKTPEDLTRMLRRSIDYEQSQSFGPWRDRIHATAGVGGFGVLADTAIESVAKRLLADGIPDRFQLNMTHASLTSPYCPDPFSLTRTFIGKINEGGMFWVYIGHGNVDRLDDFVVGKQAIPICMKENVAQFDVQNGPPIALILACFTGAFDARVDCFAETLLANDKGPIAVIAGSRVTMPYGMSQLSTEMMEGCFREKIPTLGGILLNAKRKIWKQGDIAQTDESAKAKSESVSPEQRQREKQQALFQQMAKALSPEGHDLTEERREHVRLMNLLGDPLLRIRHPLEMKLDCDSELQSGQVFVVTGVAPQAGKLRLELVLTRDRLPEGIRTVSDFQGTDDQRKSMQETYVRATDLVLTKQEKEIPAGGFSVELSVPPECRGRCVVRAFVYGATEWASGSQRTNVRRSK